MQNLPKIFPLWQLWYQIQRRLKRLLYKKSCLYQCLDVCCLIWEFRTFLCHGWLEKKNMNKNKVLKEKKIFWIASEEKLYRMMYYNEKKIYRITPIQKQKNFYLHDELDLCCEDLTKKELKTSQCLSNWRKFYCRCHISMINKAMMIFFKLSFEDNYIPQYSAMTFLASSLALICNLITKRPKNKNIKYLISKKKYQ